jgi:CHAD domain-containing protein
MSRIAPRTGQLPRLWQHEAMTAGLRRVLLKCLHLAAEAVPEDVHRARLALKRARAVLRLAERCGVTDARRARHELARHARRLAGMRDQAVVAKLAEGWAPALRGDARHCAVAVAGAAVAKPRSLSWPVWSRWLALEQRRLAKKPWPALSRQKLRRLLAKFVRRAHKRDSAARRCPGPPKLHEWRKAVISLREQLYVLAPLLVPAHREVPVRLHGVARKLGAAGDWQMLIEVMRGSRWRGRAARGRGAAILRAQEQRERALREARREWAALQGALRRKLV